MGVRWLNRFRWLHFIGCLMTIAWVFFSTIGITVARYFKPVWSDSTIKGQKVWFQVRPLLWNAKASCFMSHHECGRDI